MGGDEIRTRSKQLIPERGTRITSLRCICSRDLIPSRRKAREPVLAPVVRGCEEAAGVRQRRAGSARRFTAILGFRNRVVHLYDTIDPAIVYRILTEDRHDLIELARLLTAAIDD
jgi:hypothetical protein